MKRIIRSKYKKMSNRGVKRGVLIDGKFHRDRTPIIWGTHISLEPDAVGLLIKYGCKDLFFNARNGISYHITMIDFLKKAWRQVCGNPDSREQMFIAISDCDIVPFQTERS